MKELLTEQIRFKKDQLETIKSSIASETDKAVLKDLEKNEIEINSQLSLLFHLLDKATDSEGEIDNSINFSVEAKKFWDTYMPEDFADKLNEFVKSRGYSQNEFRLFAYKLNDTLEFNTNVFRLYYFSLNKSSL